MSLENIRDSIVLLKVDYNIPDQKNTAKIKNSIPTVQTLLKNNNKIVLITHWGRPEGDTLVERSRSRHTTKDLIRPFKKVSGKILPEELFTSPEYINQYNGFDEAADFIKNSKNTIFILENVRFEPKESSKKPEERKKLAGEYAKLGNVFVDEGFAVSHRVAATNTEIKEFFDKVESGYAYQKEIENLSKLKNNPDKPYIVIISGAKLETKLDLIEKTLPKVDRLLVAGLLCFTFLAAKKEMGQKVPDIFDSEKFIEPNFIEEAKDLLNQFGDKIVLPVDFNYGETGYNGKYSYDIGENTLEVFKKALKGSKTLFWNGPLGFYEKPPFEQGTQRLGDYIANELVDCYKVLGGGDIVSALGEDCKNKFSFISMGGGASLDYLIK